jgi:hypothetical protein
MKSTYRVTVERQLWQTATVVVEADDEDTAGYKVSRELSENEDSLGWTDGDSEDAYVSEVEEVEA